MGIVKGAPFKFIVSLTDDDTNQPAGIDIASDLDLVLYTDTSKDIALFGTTNVPIEKLSDGEFKITIDKETTAKLTEGEMAYLEGFILPSYEDIILELGIVRANRRDIA